MTPVITPEAEIYSNADRSRFVMVEFRKDGEVYLRQFARGQTIYPLDFSGCFRLPEELFQQRIQAENAVRVGVEELDWVPCWTIGRMQKMKSLLEVTP